MIPLSSHQITLNYGEAYALLASKGKSFYWASHLLGAKYTQRAARLYRFCRYLDDLVDEATSLERALASLQSLEAAVLAGNSSDAVVSDAIRLMDECRIGSDAVQELINGVRSDLGHVRYSDETMLLRYCYRVAGTVGIMMCAVLDVRDNSALPHAIDLGIAMQLTNICRDVTEDARMGRRYLPASLVGDMSPETILLPTSQDEERVKDALAKLLGLAENFYESGMAGLSFLPLGARNGILVAGHVYREIGLKLKKLDYADWKKRTVVSKAAIGAVTAKALASNVARPQFWHVVVPHEAKLHKALRGLPFVHAAEEALL